MKDTEWHEINKPLLLAGVFLLAMTLREPLLSVSPLLTLIQESYHLASQEVAMLTTLPLLVFALFSPFLGTLGVKVGVGKIITIFLFLMVIGSCIRYWGGMWGLFLGTFFIATGIVAGNVLIPSILGAFFMKQVGTLTGVYSALMQLTTGVALVTVAFMASKIGWNLTLFIWTAPIFLAFFVWIFLYSLQFPLQEDTQKKPTIKSIYRHRLAWDVSLFMGIQSLLFYTITTWYPTIVMAQGLSREMAGVQAFIYQITSLIASFVTPLLVKKEKEQKWITLSLCVLYGIGIMFILHHSEWVLYLASACMGIGAGATFSIALLYFIWRTSSPSQVAILSGVGQAIGYALAATGPTLVGYMYEHSDSWMSTLFFLLFFCALYGVVGYRAGRNQTL